MGDFPNILPNGDPSRVPPLTAFSVRHPVLLDILCRHGGEIQAANPMNDLCNSSAFVVGTSHVTGRVLVDLRNVKIVLYNTWYRSLTHAPEILVHSSIGPSMHYRIRLLKTLSLNLSARQFRLRHQTSHRVFG